MRAIAVALFAVLSGCLTPGAAPLADDDSPQATRLLQACNEIIAIHPVPAEDAAPLPPGFSHVAMDPSGAFVESVVIAAECSGEVDAFIMHSVRPPAAWNDDDALVQVFLMALMAEPAHAAWYLDQGIDVIDIDSSQHEVTRGPAGSAGMFHAGTDQGSMSIQAAVGEPSAEPAGHGWLWYMDGAELALLEVRLGPRDQAIGTSTLSTGMAAPGLPATLGEPSAGLGVTLTGAEYNLEFVRMSSADPTIATPR